MAIKIDETKQKSFQLKKERTLLQGNPPNLQTSEENTNHKERKFKYTYSRAKTKTLFNEIVAQIPKWKGVILVFGDDGEYCRSIEYTFSTNNLRDTFLEKQKTLNGNTVDRFTWMEGVLLSGQYKKLKIFFANSY